MDKTILILGSGIGGIVTARELRRHLGESHRIILVDREPVLAFPPSFLWVMIGWRTPEAVQKSLALVSKYGIEYRRATVEEISVADRKVRTSAETIPFDYLVIALGAEPLENAAVGSRAGFQSLDTLRCVEDLRRRIGAFGQGSVAVVIGGTPYRCPPVPYETAFLLDSYFRRRSASVSIEVATPEKEPLSGLGRAAGGMIRTMTGERAIGLRTGIAAAPEADLVIYIPPVGAPGVVRDAGITDASGWIPVDPHSMETAHENIFAIGDIAGIRLPEGFAFPKGGILAADHAETAAHIIARRIHGREPVKFFNGVGSCFLEVGNGRAGFIHAELYASPEPKLVFHEPSVGYHWAKVVHEKYWLWRWF
ncbi:MAG TPA: FAD/NAD(P)-binding oxidoreductase [Bacteroidota bacterium]|nr:FAD/NAD(P)-binding oxidoreductase [Bacteroidota bacterium]